MLIGRFDADAKAAQVVSFDPSGLYLNIWRGLGTGDGFSELSTQKMR